MNPESLPNYLSKTHAVKHWIEEIVLAKNFCPPLSRYVSDKKQHNGSVNWDIAPQIEFTEINFDQNDLLATKVNKIFDWYQQLYIKIAQGSDVLSSLLILPANVSNPEYDELNFLAKLKIFNWLAKDPKLENGNSIVTTILSRFADPGIATTPDLANKLILNWSRHKDAIATTNITQDNCSYLLANPKQQPAWVVLMNIVDGGLNATNFYGQNISDADLLGFNTGGLNPQKQKVLSQAPFPVIQVNNTTAQDVAATVGNLDGPELRRVNSKKALAMDLKEFRFWMDKIRANTEG